MDDLSVDASKCDLPTPQSATPLNTPSACETTPRVTAETRLPCCSFAWFRKKWWLAVFPLLLLPLIWWTFFSGPTVLRNAATLKGHRLGVRALAFSPDGTMLASAGYDCVVRLWDVKNRTELRTIRQSTSPVEALAFAPDGKTLAVASDACEEVTFNAAGQITSEGGKLGDCTDKTKVWLFDVSSGELTGRIAGDFGTVRALAFSPNGKLLCTGGGEIKMWDTATWNQKPSVPSNGTVCTFRTPDMGTRKMSGFQCRSFGAETSAQRRNGPKPRSSWKF